MLKHLYRKWLNGPITKSTIKTTFVLGLRLLVQAGTLLCVARMLGPEQFGAFAGVAALAVLMGTFATFGTHLVLLGEVSKNPVCRDEVLAYAVPTTLITGSLLFVLYLVVFQLSFSSLVLSLAAVACIGITEMLILPLFLLPAIEELALEKTAQSQLLIVLPLTLRMITALAVMLIAPEQPLTIFSYLYLSTALVALGLMKMYKSDGWLCPKDWRLPTVGQLKKSTGYAVLAMTAAGPSELDKILALKLMPLGTSGLYAAASRVIGATLMPVIALLLSAMPRLFRYSVQSNTQGRHLTKWIFISVFIYGVLLSGFIYFVAFWLELLFGNEFVGMAHVLQLLCLVVPGMVLRHTVTSVLMTLDLPWVRAGVEFFGMFLLILLAMVFTAFGWKYSLIWASAASEWVAFLMGLIMLWLERLKTGNGRGYTNGN